MRQLEALRLVGNYAADQGGLVTSAQAKIVGVDGVTLRRLVDARLLEHVTHGVYGMPAVMAAEHLLERAAWLRLAPGRPGWERKSLDPDGGVLSHRSAAALHGLGDMVADFVEITVPRRRTSRDPNVRLRTGRLTDDDVASVDGLPVTTVERTIADLLADHTDGGHIGDVIADAHRRHLVDLHALSTWVARYAAAYGIPDRGADLGMKLIAQLLEQVGYQGGNDSDYVTAKSQDRGVEHGRQVAAVVDRLVALDPEVLDNIAKLLQATGAVENLTRGISEQTGQMIANTSAMRALAREVAEMLRPTIEAAWPESARLHLAHNLRHCAALQAADIEPFPAGDTTDHDDDQTEAQ